MWLEVKRRWFRDKDQENSNFPFLWWNSSSYCSPKVELEFWNYDGFIGFRRENCVGIWVFMIFGNLYANREFMEVQSNAVWFVSLEAVVLYNEIHKSNLIQKLWNFTVLKWRCIALIWCVDHNFWTSRLKDMDFWSCALFLECNLEQGKLDEFLGNM